MATQIPIRYSGVEPQSQRSCHECQRRLTMHEQGQGQGSWQKGYNQGQGESQGFQQQQQPYGKQGSYGQGQGSYGPYGQGSCQGQGSFGQGQGYESQFQQERPTDFSRFKEQGSEQREKEQGKEPGLLEKFKQKVGISSDKDQQDVETTKPVSQQQQDIQGIPMQGGYGQDIQEAQGGVMTQQPQQQQQGVSQQVGQWGERTLTNQIATHELTLLHSLLSVVGHCYKREHVFMRLCRDANGVIKNWHKQVTIKTLDQLVPFAKKFGLTLPFPTLLEQREQEIKSSLAESRNVLTDGEVIKDIQINACVLQQLLHTGFMSSLDPEFRQLCQHSCENLCQNVVKLNEVFAQTKDFYPPPIVHEVYMRHGVPDRK